MFIRIGDAIHIPM